jgi:hypothetical protein
MNGGRITDQESSMSVSFDGSSALQTGTSDDYNLTGDFTIGFEMAFTHPLDGSGNPAVYAMRLQGENGQHISFDFDDTDGNGHGFWVYWNNTGGPERVWTENGSVGKYADGKPHHYTVTRIGSTMTVLVDGEAIGSYEYSGAIAANNMVLGAINTDAARGINGDIDNVFVLNGQGLTKDEVNNYNQNGVDTTNENLVTYYDFEGDNPFADKSGHGNDMNIVAGNPAVIDSAQDVDTDLRPNGTDATLPQLGEVIIDEVSEAPIDFTDADLVGTMGDDSVEGTSEAEVIDTQDGNDEIIQSGADSIDAGAGDDNIYMTDINFNEIQGGSGDDTLYIEEDLDIDFNDLSSKLHDVEELDLTRADVTLKGISVEDVLDITSEEDERILKITGNENDAIGLKQNDWVKSEETKTDEEGNTYDVYVAETDPTVELQIDQRIAEVDMYDN